MASYGDPRDDYGSSSSSSPSTSSSTSQQQQQQQQQRPRQTILNPQTGLPLEFHDQLTPQEVETMTLIRRNASRARSTGGILGASTAALYMLRKKKTLLSFRSVFNCFGGSLLGSWLFVPIGVAWSSSMVKRVENPNHLIGILTEVSKARTRGQRPASGPEAFPRQQGQGSSNQVRVDSAAQSMSSSLPPTPTPPPIRTSARTRGAQTNQWGDEINAPEMAPYSSDTNSTTPAYQYNAASSSSTPSSSGRMNSESESGSQTQSRWAQLRGQRQVQESSWEKIRQENARDVYNRQAASGQGRPDQAAFGQESPYSGQSGGELADPTFGKGSFPSQTQAQREYEKSFERERRGVDGR